MYDIRKCMYNQNEIQDVICGPKPKNKEYFTAIKNQFDKKIGASYKL